jgi:hypothetical protein
MKIKTLEIENVNSGLVKYNENNSKTLIIKGGRYIIENTEESNPLYDEDNRYFKRVYCLEHNNNKIYWLNLYGSKDTNGYHIALNYIQYNRFLWLQKLHWLQKEENIRYCVNIFFLIIGLWLSIKKL